MTEAGDQGQAAPVRDCRHFHVVIVVICRICVWTHILVASDGVGPRRNEVVSRVL